MDCADCIALSARGRDKECVLCFVMDVRPSARMSGRTLEGGGRSLTQTNPWVDMSFANESFKGMLKKEYVVCCD